VKYQIPLLFFLLPIASLSRADEPKTYQHVLDGHSFIPMYFVDRAFSDTTALLSLGAASRTIGNGNQDLQLAGLAPRLNVQANVWKTLAVSFGLTGSVVTGVNSSSALQYGASSSYTWTFGALYEFLRDDTNAVSAAFEINRPHTFAVSPLNVTLANLAGILRGADPAAVASGVETQYRPTVRWAHAFGPAYGVQSSLGISANSGESVEDTGPKLLFGVGGDVDFNHVFNFPLSVGVSYARNQILARPANNSDTLGFAFYESTGHSFNVGGELAFVWSEGNSTTAAVIAFRTYFN
jgi:hypothetical protein